MNIPPRSRFLQLLGEDPYDLVLEILTLTEENDRLRKLAQICEIGQDRSQRMMINVWNPASVELKEPSRGEIDDR